MIDRFTNHTSVSVSDGFGSPCRASGFVAAGWEAAKRTDVASNRPLMITISKNNLGAISRRHYS